jgi:predicted Zn-dependent protease
VIPHHSWPNCPIKSQLLHIIEDVAAKEAASPALGPQHPDTLASRYLLAQVLNDLGRTADALPIIEDVAAKNASPDRGPQHPDTLASRYLLAQVLNDLGRAADALPIIEDVAAKQAASPEFGPQHRGTRASQHLLAQVRHSLGQETDTALRNSCRLCENSGPQRQ